MSNIRHNILTILFFGIATLAYSAESVESVSSETIERIAEKTAEKLAKKINGEQVTATTGNSPHDTTNPTLADSVKTSDDKQLHPPKLMRIGSGGVGGNYFVLGELVGGVISHPASSLPCGHGGTCGIHNLQTQNITTAGSLANLNKLQKGEIDSAFVQSDIAFWAYTGTGIFANKDKLTDIRAIASLYPEAMHIVVRKDAGINNVGDLNDKRVSVGARRSGTLHGARLILEAYKLSEDDLLTEYLDTATGLKKLADGELDAVFFTVGAPAPAIARLFTDNNDFQLLSLDDAQRQSIFKKGHYFSPYTIAANTYRNSRATHTISVYALWLTTENSDEDLVYNMTKAIWGDVAKQLFNSSYIGRRISIDNSLKGIGIPLHTGAKKYYNEIGKRF